MSLTSYRAAPPRVMGLHCNTKGRLRGPFVSALGRCPCCVEKIVCGRRLVSEVCDFWAPFVSFAFSRPGSDLLSRVLRRSTIGAGAFHGRVRNGNGCSHPARTTRSAKGKCFMPGHDHSFLFSALANLSCSLVARKGAKAAIRERMNMP